MGREEREGEISRGREGGRDTGRERKEEGEERREGCARDPGEHKALSCPLPLWRGHPVQRDLWRPVHCVMVASAAARVCVVCVTLLASLFLLKQFLLEP